MHNGEGGEEARPELSAPAEAPALQGAKAEETAKIAETAKVAAIGMATETAKIVETGTAAEAAETVKIVETGTERVTAAEPAKNVDIERGTAADTETAPEPAQTATRFTAVSMPAQHLLTFAPREEAGSESDSGEEVPFVGESDYRPLPDEESEHTESLSGFPVDLSETASKTENVLPSVVVAEMLRLPAPAAAQPVSSAPEPLPSARQSAAFRSMLAKAAAALDPVHHDVGKDNSAASEQPEPAGHNPSSPSRATAAGAKEGKRRDLKTRAMAEASFSAPSSEGAAMTPVEPCLPSSAKASEASSDSDDETALVTALITDVLAEILTVKGRTSTQPVQGAAQDPGAASRQP
jgi:hypothetical protein